MRLIDADEFKKYIRDACNEMSHVYKDGGKWAKQITEDFCMDIDEQPTIEERKTGKWERHNTYHGDDTSGFVDPDWRCSECGRQANVNALCMYNLTEFCPHCGARMEGEEDG